MGVELILFIVESYGAEITILRFLGNLTYVYRFLNHILYLPKRVRSLSSFHYLAFGAAHRYERATDTWSEGSDLIGFYGGTRGLFVQNNCSIVYVGTFKCHDLRALHPGGLESQNAL